MGRAIMGFQPAAEATGIPGTWAPDVAAATPTASEASFVAAWSTAAAAPSLDLAAWRRFCILRRLAVT